MLTIDTSRYPKLVKRFPREYDPAVLELTARIKRRLILHRNDRIEIGQMLRHLKDEVVNQHGEWRDFYKQNIAAVEGAPALRTAQKWMRLARAAEQDKNARGALLLFPQAQDAEAAARQEANAKAREKVRKNALYQLLLHLTPEDRENMDKIRRSAGWPTVEQRIVAFLKQLISKSAAPSEQEIEREETAAPE